MSSSRPHNARHLRAEVDAHLAAGNNGAAQVALGTLWRQEATQAAAGFVNARFARLRNHVPTTQLRVAVARSFTVEPVVSLLRASAAVAGIDVTIQVGEFNAYAQELIDPASRLYAFDPDAVILAVQTRDIAPELWDQFAERTTADVNMVIERVADELRVWIEAFRTRTNAHLIVHTLETPAWPCAGILDAQSDTGQTAAVRAINGHLLEIAADVTGVYLLDYDGLIAQHGRLRWHDPRMWLTVRLPIRADCLRYLAQEWLRFLHPIGGTTCKALVCDLDNTLWGGIIGEDGMNGIQVGVDYPGAAFRQFQRAILDLHCRGIILAVCSKNNYDDAMEAIEKHPDMLLRSRHFAALRINWHDKAQNLPEIAAELNIGIDAMAFVDDNPVERQLVREQLPEVTVIDLPKEPLHYAAALHACGAFERLSLSGEDRRRGELYASQRQRAQLRNSARTLEDFYRSLDMAAEFGLVDERTIGRVAQLTQKTNQLNTTTRRYTEQEIGEMAGDPACYVYWVRVTDRFGDNGIVGIAIVHVYENTWELDTFLLSCRVIGRTVETAMLGTIAAHARKTGATRLTGSFLPTKKNAPAKEIYRENGFSCTSEGPNGSRWEFDLTAGTIEVPDWIQCTAPMLETV